MKKKFGVVYKRRPHQGGWGSSDA